MHRTSGVGRERWVVEFSTREGRGFGRTATQCEQVGRVLERFLAYPCHNSSGSRCGIGMESGEWLLTICFKFLPFSLKTR